MQQPVTKCHLCGGQTGVIRYAEIEEAIISHRAHVDCRGHSQYRSVSPDELAAALAYKEFIDGDSHCIHLKAFAGVIR